MEVVKLPLSILAKLSKEILEKSKFFNKRDKKADEPEKPKKLYAQASDPSIGEILRLKMLWNALDTNIFLFLLSIFLDFIFLFF